MQGQNWREDNGESSENVNWALKEESTWGKWEGGVVQEAISSKRKQHHEQRQRDGQTEQVHGIPSSSAGQDESTSSKKRLT